MGLQDDTIKAITDAIANIGLRVRELEAVEVSIGGGAILWATTRIVAGDSPYAALSTDVIIYCDTDGGAITIDLPAGIDGTLYRIINSGSSGNDVTVDGSGGETVMGALTQTLSDGEIIIIVFETTENWW